MQELVLEPASVLGGWALEQFHYPPIVVERSRLRRRSRAGGGLRVFLDDKEPVPGALADFRSCWRTYGGWIKLRRSTLHASHERRADRGWPCANCRLLVRTLYVK